jgi:hypothetical protein
VVTWFREHRDSVRWGVWAWTVGIPAFAIMVALLRRLLPAPHDDVFLVGAVAYATMIAIYTWTFAALALHADQLEPATARTILDGAGLTFAWILAFGIWGGFRGGMIRDAICR